VKKLVCLIFLFGFVMNAVGGPIALAAQDNDFADPYLPITVKQADGTLINTQLSAYVRKHETLVPLSIATEYLKRDYLVESDGAGLYFKIAAPPFAMDTPNLTEFLKEGVDFRLGATSIYGMPHVNLNGLETLLHIAVTKTADGRGLLISKLPETSSEKAIETKKLHALRVPFKPAGKISLVWDHFLGDPVDLAQEEKIPGLTVISPTWFAVIDGRGAIASKADWKYVQDAHDKGYKVWALISNSFDPDMTKVFLTDESAQDRAVRQLLIYTALYDLDGINIDFENVYDDDSDALTAFVAKLTDKLREQRIVSSIDTTVPSGVPMWSKCYDRAALAKLVDYFMVMTYDEHWRTSPIAGSVASIGWVERGIQNTLQYVPREKLLMGVPFYTREWRESDNGRVRSSTMLMADVENRIARYGVTPSWLDTAGQHYMEYSDDSARYRVWIEDAKSLTLKVDLARKYELAGVAAWRKGFEKPGIWDAVHSALGKKPEPVSPDPMEMDRMNWSLKSLMEKLKGAAGKGVSE
jgi:hypothetical protein